MKRLGKFICIIMALVFTFSMATLLIGCEDSKYSELNQQINELKERLDAIDEKNQDAPFDYTEQCYQKIKYIDKELKDRDCYKGEKDPYGRPLINDSGVISFVK